MMQTADEGLPMFSQETPDAPGETPTLSEINIAPALTCDLYQNSVVCLPVVSDSTRVIWINFNQTSLQLDSATELQLDKAFDSFPYLTQDQTAALAQRCSLHPDQVKVWFMVQRLRYGISWDYKDIRDVRKKIKSGWGKKELRKDEGEKKRSGRKKGRKVREEQSAKEGSTMGENMTEYKQEKPMKKENDSKVGELEEDKRRKTTVTDKMGKKTRVERAGETEIGCDEVKRESTKSPQMEATPCSRKKRKAKASKGLLSVQEWLDHKSLVVPDEAWDAPPLGGQVFDVPQVTDIQTPNMESGLKEEAELELELKCEAESADHSGVKVKELAEMTTPVRRLRIHWNTKTRAQLAMMKEAFSRCQYPDSKDYDQLSVLTGVSRHTLVQWYGDMRYYIKERKPGWMTEEQHRQALANIRYRQYLNMLGKMDGGDKNTLNIELDKGEHCGKDENVQLPPE